MDHFRVFLSGIASDPACALVRLPLISGDERNQILVEFNDLVKIDPEVKTVGRDGCESITQLFEAQALEDPTATALVFGDERLSYETLNGRANQVARYLRGIGVGPEVLVGICLERSVEMIVGILAVLKAGGAYVPLDPSYPKERISHMLSDSEARVLLTNDRHSQALDDYHGTVVSLDGDAETIAREDSLNLPASVVPRRPDDLAYVIYTSGSTGKPKGVAIEQRNALALLHWAMGVYDKQQLKGTLASTSICFDLSVFEIFLPLACGGSIILVENILHLPAVSRKCEVTLINTVPSAITELLRIKGIPSSVRTANLAGEPLKSSLVEKIYEIGTVEKVYDLYGPTEDTTYSTFKLRDLGPATIGRPIKNTQAYVLDRHLQPVPIGIAGELYLGGDGLARGYLNRPDLTSEKFVRNPFEDAPSARIYKTGDLARFLENGEIEYLGRIDNQVKIRGFRIELGEIEAKLADHPKIREVVVVPREDVEGDKRLVAYFVAEGFNSIDGNEVRGYLSERLPDFMVPSAFVELAELPLTPNGKIDRKALPKPSVSLSKSENEILRGRDTIERRLAEIWERLLDISPIGVKDNFFELGGDSLKAVRMFAELEETFGKNIPLATLFGAGTIEELGEILRMDGWAEPESCLVPIQPAGTKPTFFCIHAKGGNVLFYRDLAKHLGTDQPFYGVQARRLGGRQVGHSTVEEMADFYIKEIKEFQPNGPYFVGGSSFGGLAAFEIAKRLHDRGDEVGVVALFDTGTPDYPQPLPNVSRVRLKVNGVVLSIRHHRNRLRALDARHKAAYILEKLAKFKLHYRRKVVGMYKKTVRRVYRNFDSVSPLPAKYIQIEDQIWRAGQIYQPGVYAGKLTLFRASDQPYGIQPDPTLGWDRYVSGELEIQEVPGQHGSIVTEPYVSVLAEKLAECIRTAQLNGKAGHESQTRGVPSPVGANTCQIPFAGPQNH
jgi:amino acid adenylation domain-containing protein